MASYPSQRVNVSAACVAFAILNARKLSYRVSALFGSTLRSSDTYCVPRFIANSSPYVLTRGIDSLNSPKIPPRSEQRACSLGRCVVED
jgi:hypothetical protein